MRSVPALLAVCALLAACGQKGDLYFPEQQREVVTAPSAPTAPDETEEQRRQRAPATNTAPAAPAAGAN